MLGDGQLRIARVNRPTVDLSPAHPFDRPPDRATGELICRLLEEGHHGGEPILLALGSLWCASASVTVPTPQQARKRAAMQFLLEPYLPWSAEEVVADYELCGKSRAFMAAAETDPLAKVVAAMEEHSITVASIAPLARLALEHQKKADPSFGQRHVVLWREDSTIDVWLVDKGRPTMWRWLPHDPEVISQALGQLVFCEGASFPVVARNLESEFRQMVASRTGLEFRDLEPLPSEDPYVAAAMEGALVLEGRCEAPLEFRRDRLAAQDRHRSLRSQLRFLQATALLLMAAVGVAFYLQARETDRLREDCVERQAAVFHRLFPKQRAPLAVQTRLESELTRLKDLRGEQPDLPRSVAVLDVLERLLKSLPTDMRLQLLEMRIDNGHIYIVGHVRAHGDADRFADALRGVGFDVPPPNTNRLQKEGVEFRISARSIGADDKKTTKKPA